MFVQNTDNFSPHSRQDILNIYYTAINSGKESFTFYCPNEYKNCLKEIETLANKILNIQSLATLINQRIY